MKIPKNIYTLYFDGACKPSPGGIGTFAYVINRLGELKEGNGVIGQFEDMTNHFAEFYSLYRGLKTADTYLIRPGIIHVKGDSDLVIKNMTDKWKGNPKKVWFSLMKECKILVKQLRKKGHNVIFSWVPRERNQRCDFLSKQPFAI